MFAALIGQCSYVLLAYVNLWFVCKSVHIYRSSHWSSLVIHLGVDSTPDVMVGVPVPLHGAGADWIVAVCSHFSVAVDDTWNHQPHGDQPSLSSNCIQQLIWPQWDCSQLYLIFIVYHTTVLQIQLCCLNRKSNFICLYFLTFQRSVALTWMAAATMLVWRLWSQTLWLLQSQNLHLK